MENEMTRGFRIKQRREILGLSQIEVANAIHVSKQTLYKYENDIVTNIPSDKIEALARILETTPEFLMGWDENQLVMDIATVYEHGSVTKLKEGEFEYLLEIRRLKSMYGEERFEKAWELITRLMNLPAEQQTALLTLLGGSQTDV